MKNNIRYINNTSFSCDPKLPPMVLCLREPPVRFLWCWLFIQFCIFIVLLFLVYFQVTLPCFRYSTLSSQVREGLHQLWALPWLLLIAFAFSSTAGDMVLSRHFLPTGVFLPCAPSPTFLTQPAIIKASLGARSSSLMFSGLHADPRNTDPVHLFVWFTAIHNLHTQKNLFLNSTKYYHELLVVKV